MKRPLGIFFVILAAAIVLTAFASSAQTSPTEEDLGFHEDLERRAEYLKAHGLMDTAADVFRREQLLEKLRAKESTVAHLRGHDGAGQGSVPLIWKPIGPAPLPPSGATGRVSAIAFDPVTPSTVYLGVGQGGIWKSRNGGNNWVCLTEDLPTQSIGAIAVDPSNPVVIYAGTGDPNGSDPQSGLGVLKSTDGGKTWKLVSQPFFSSGFDVISIGSIAVHPTNGKIVIAGTSIGLYWSGDGGLTFHPTGSQLARADEGQIVFDPSHPDVVFASWTYSSNQLWKSTDAGLHWRQVLDTGSQGSSVVAIARSNPAIMYFAVGVGPYSALYKSLNYGETWQRLPATNLCTGQCSYNLAIAVNPTDADEVYFGGIVLWHSRDGGASWIEPFSGTHVDIHALAFTPAGDWIYNGNDGGIARHSASGPDDEQWSPLIGNLNTVLFYPGISMKAGDPSSAMAGAQDLGGGFLNHGFWSFLPFGDGYGTAFDSANDFGYAAGNYFAVAKMSSDGSFQFLKSGIDSTDSGVSMAADPSIPQRLYYGSEHDLYVTNDSGNSWTPIYDSYIADIIVSPANSEVVYMLAGACNVCVTSNASAGAGATWTTAHNGMPPYGMSRVVAHPVDVNTAFATSTTNSNNSNGNTITVVFKTTDRGQHWTNISGDLPDIKVYDLAVDPDTETYYIGTDAGVFASQNNGVNWTLVGQGLPVVSVTGVLFDRATRMLRVGTYGRGMWDLYFKGLQVPSQELDFDTTIVHRTSAVRTVTLWNSSERAISIGIAKLIGSDQTGAFSQTNNCGSMLAAGAQCTVTVSFTATSASVIDGGLTIVSDGVDGVHDISLIGEGLDFNLTNPRPSRSARLTPGSKMVAGRPQRAARVR